MMDLLLDCSIFFPVMGNRGNYYQISGLPVSDQKPPQTLRDTSLHAGGLAGTKSTSARVLVEHRTPNNIAFVRSRMMYAKAALNAKGGIRFGMRHIRSCNAPEYIIWQLTK